MNSAADNDTPIIIEPDNPPINGTDGPNGPGAGIQRTPEEWAAYNAAKIPQPEPRTHQRAGITKNKGHGTSKARRKMAAASRRKNRGA